MSRKIKFVVGEYYHIYNRGVDKRVIFSTKYDHVRFMILLAVCNDDVQLSRNMIPKLTLDSMAIENRVSPIVSIGVYSLMPNHFHIVIKEIVQGGISKFMHRLSTAYSMYFNNRNNRTGSLFEGAFKAKHINDDRYMYHLFSYIHLNPLKLVDKNWKDNNPSSCKSNKSFLTHYQYSSYLDYSGVVRIENSILDRENFPKYFDNKEEFQSMIYKWLSADY
ncbi:hypothetical protein COB55_02875 [Candidatus Wolfebacteria bacterium]|nr:MAG: hypothetical protein COB55_02875 [Candidatus Wolfebacteria bacterium]